MKAFMKSTLLFIGAMPLLILTACNDYDLASCQSCHGQDYGKKKNQQFMSNLPHETKRPRSVQYLPRQSSG